MKKELDYPDQLQPFSVSDDILTDILDDSFEIEKIDGYQGTPISGVGDVYTPEPIVEFILDSVGYTTESEIEHITIADLSCGTGSFIKEIVRRLRDRMIKIGYDPDSPEGARQIISTIKNNVYGYDINSLAVWRTSQLILDTIRREIKSANLINPVSTLPIYHTNSLNRETEIASNKFDLIVGNPPYIKNEDISPENDNKYREKYDSAIGKYDIYLLFFERTIDLLDKNGKLGFVTPDRFHQADYGENLRKILTNRTYIDLIVKIENDPFPVVNAYPCITILQKQDTSFPNYQKENYITYCEATSDRLSDLRQSLHNNQERSEFNGCVQIEQGQLGEDSWQFMPPRIQKLKSRIGDNLTQIKQTDIQIRAGIATGADDILILSETDAQRMSNQVVYPLVRGENIRKGEVNQELYILNPYDSDGKVKDDGSDRGTNTADIESALADRGGAAGTSKSQAVAGAASRSSRKKSGGLGRSRRRNSKDRRRRGGGADGMPTVSESSEPHAVEAQSNAKYGAEIVGKRVCVYWPEENMFFPGTVVAHDASSGKHHIEYDDNDEEHVLLEAESFYFEAEPKAVPFEQVYNSRQAKRELCVCGYVVLARTQDGSAWPAQIKSTSSVSRQNAEQQPAFFVHYFNGSDALLSLESLADFSANLETMRKSCSSHTSALCHALTVRLS